MLMMLRSAAALAGLATILVVGIQRPASAQQMSPCGYWSEEGIWVATPCAAPYQTSPYQRYNEAISGTIVGVSANILTVQIGPTQAVTVNDEPALNRMDTGRIYAGRVITAYGYWDGGEFVATSIA